MWARPGMCSLPQIQVSGMCPPCPAAVVTGRRASAWASEQSDGTSARTVAVRGSPSMKGGRPQSSLPPEMCRRSQPGGLQRLGASESRSAPVPWSVPGRCAPRPCCLSSPTPPLSPCQAPARTAGGKVQLSLCGLSPSSPKRPKIPAPPQPVTQRMSDTPSLPLCSLQNHGPALSDR